MVGPFLRMIAVYRCVGIAIACWAACVGLAIPAGATFDVLSLTTADVNASGTFGSASRSVATPHSSASLRWLSFGRRVCIRHGDRQSAIHVHARLLGLGLRIWNFRRHRWKFRDHRCASHHLWAAVVRIGVYL